MKQNYISKILILFSLCLAGKMSYAQTFEQVLPPPPTPQFLSNIKGDQNSSIAFTHINNDLETLFKHPLRTINSETLK